MTTLAEKIKRALLDMEAVWKLPNSHLRVVDDKRVAEWHDALRLAALPPDKCAECERLRILLQESDSAMQFFRDRLYEMQARAEAIEEAGRRLADAVDIDCDRAILVDLADEAQAAFALPPDKCAEKG